MATIEELADRVERLLLRHEELQRTNALLGAQLGAVTNERDNLRSRLNAAKSRIDVLLQRLPRDPESDGVDGAAVDAAKTSGNSGATLRSVG
jgi:cell division protein ZapB